MIGPRQGLVHAVVDQGLYISFQTKRTLFARRRARRAARAEPTPTRVERPLTMVPGSRRLRLRLRARLPHPHCTRAHTATPARGSTPGSNTEASASVAAPRAAADAAPHAASRRIDAQAR